MIFQDIPKKPRLSLNKGRQGGQTDRNMQDHSGTERSHQLVYLLNACTKLECEDSTLAYPLGRKQPNYLIPTLLPLRVWRKTKFNRKLESGARAGYRTKYSNMRCGILPTRLTVHPKEFLFFFFLSIKFYHWSLKKNHWRPSGRYLQHSRNKYGNTGIGPSGVA